MNKVKSSLLPSPPRDNLFSSCLLHLRYMQTQASSPIEAVNLELALSQLVFRDATAKVFCYVVSRRDVEIRPWPSKVHFIGR